MYKLIKKIEINPKVFLLEFEAKDIALSAKPGQFVIFRIDEKGERFPLTLYDWDINKGKITVVCQAIGLSTHKLCSLQEKEFVLDIVGPLGQAIVMDKVGKVICIGGGVGTAEIYPIVKYLKDKSDFSITIIGAKSKEFIICEKEIKSICDKVYIVTDDGSYGEKGFVTNILSKLLEKDKYDTVFSVGPILMMKSVSDITKEYNIKTFVSLNPIMIDGTGMCGGCRVIYNGDIKFACVDGPLFNGHLIDYEDLMYRQQSYLKEENI